ncbi:CBS domain-containing protein [Thiohalomonas denitrificans]|uniref:CBS domain-containing protein n=1 Tax=Thiohalomonas denitrificans TaxID=415747 RepID=UPI0026F25E8A|nr:CBS domain-containing protein [Thiohalomonas denitrificans]
MSVGEWCNREVIVIKPDESPREAVWLMRKYHVGDLVVVREDPDGRRPLGMITDRDIVIELTAEDVEPEKVTVGDIMSRDLLVLHEEEDLVDATNQMAEHGVRRAPVVNQREVLVGLLAADDILEVLAEQVSDLVRIARKEQLRERRLRP